MKHPTNKFSHHGTRSFFQTPDTTSIGELKCRVNVYSGNGICYFHVMNPNVKYGVNAYMSRMQFTLLEAESIVKFLKPILKSVASNKQGKLLPCFGGSLVAAGMKQDEAGFWDSGSYCLILNSIKIRVTQPSHHFNPCFIFHCPGKGDRPGNFIYVYKDTMFKLLEYLEKNVQLMK